MKLTIEAPSVVVVKTVGFDEVREGVFFAAFEVEPQSGLYMRLGNDLLVFTKDASVMIYRDYGPVKLTPRYFEKVKLVVE